MLTSDPFILDRRIYQQAYSLAKDGFFVEVVYTVPDLILPEPRHKNLKFTSKSLFKVNSASSKLIWKWWRIVRDLGSHSIFLIRIYQFLIAKLKDTSKSWANSLLEFDWPEVDLIVCHDVPLLETALRLKPVTNAKKVLLDAHEIFDAQYDAIYSNTSLNYWSRVCREFTPQADAVTTVTDLIALEMQKRFSLESRPVTVQNSYPKYNYLPNIKKYQIHDLYNISKDKKVLLCMGEMRPGRNLEDLIQAMKHVEDENIVLVFLGFITEIYKHKLYEFISSNCIQNVYLGKHVAPECVVDYACSANLGIVSNRGEGPNNTLGGPNRVYEYIQARLPVLAYDHQGIKQIVDEYGIGRVCRWKSPKELAILIEDMIDLKLMIPEQLENAAESVCWESDYKNYKAVIETLLK